MALKSAVLPIPLLSFASSSMTGSYQAFSSHLTQACILVRIINDSSQDVTLSYDGTTDHDYIRSGETVNLSLQANAREGEIANFQRGTRFFVKGSAGTGNIYIAGYYQQP